MSVHNSDLLPEVIVPVNAICMPYRDYHDRRPPEKQFRGQCYCYDLGIILEAAKATKLNLNDYLLSHLAHAITSKSPRAPILIWYGGAQGLLMLTVCSKTNINLDEMWKIAGYSEQGMSPLPRNSEPFIYYDGHNIFRVYIAEREIRSNRYLVSDLGAGFSPTFVAPVTEVEWKRIASNPKEYVEYVVVPSDPESVIEWQKRKMVICHAFCELKP